MTEIVSGLRTDPVTQLPMMRISKRKIVGLPAIGVRHTYVLDEKYVDYPAAFK